MISLYLDEDVLSGIVRRGLSQARVDVLTAWDAGLKARSDEEHLAFATEHGRLLVSSNIRDYARLDRDWRRVGRRHAGIILIEQGRLSPGEVLRRLLFIAAAAGDGDLDDTLAFLNEWGEADR